VNERRIPMLVEFKDSFFKHALEAFTYKQKKVSNDELRGKKDRRRLSLNRTFFGDYINFKENFALKAIVGKDVKVHFSDMVNKIDRTGKKKRLIFVMSEFDICLIKLDKNKDKNTRRTNPYAYAVFRRIPYESFQSITFSSLADNFFDIKVLNEPDSLLENRKKTEIISMVKKASPNTQILFSDVFNIDLKKKKRTQFNFQVVQEAPDGGLVKGKSIKAPPGLGKDAYPDIKEPVKVEHTRGGYSGYGDERRQMEIPPQNNRAPPPGRGNRNNNNNGDDDDDQAPPKRSTGRLPSPRRG